MPFKYAHHTELSFQGRVNDLSFSTDGKLLVVATDKTITIWETDSWTRCDVILKKPSPTADPTSVIWIDILTLVVGFSDGGLYTFEISPPSCQSQVSALVTSQYTANKEFQCLTIHGMKCATECISHMSYSGTSSLLAVGSSSEVQLWERDHGEHLPTI